MRVIAGEFKGRRLGTPGWSGLRPTSDRLRETLFNVLAPHIQGARVLDAFAGTGAVGIEALSRGAREVTFVESDPRAVALVERNLGLCRIHDRYAIIRARFADAARRLPAGGFDIVFVDPPYGPEALAEAVGLAAALVAPHGRVIAEHARRDPPPARSGERGSDRPGRLALTRDLGSGDSALAFYAIADGEEKQAAP